MLTFNQFCNLILESRLDFLKEKFKNISASHDTLATHKKPEAIVDHFATHADPSKKKVHTQWILNKYSKGQFRQEDTGRIRDTLTNFEKHKNKLEHKDLNQYHSLADLEDKLESHLGTFTSKKEEDRHIKVTGAPIIHQDNGVTIRHIKTKEAACQIGAGTKWCTAGKNNNMFDKYDKKGPLFSIHHEGRKYQFHNASGQLADEKDEMIKIGDMHHAVQKELIAAHEHPEIQALNIMHRNPHLQAKHYEEAINHDNWRVRREIAKHPTHAGKLVNDPNWQVRGEVAQHPQHAGKLVNDPEWYVRGEVAKHPQHAGKLVNDPYAFVREQVAQHPQHAGKLINDSDWSVRAQVAKHPAHAEKLINDSNSYVRRRVAKHSQHAEKILKIEK
jgi:hypothetical protein